MKIGEVKKISQVTMDDLKSLNIKHMHYDASDSSRYISNEETLEYVKKSIIQKYGDIDVKAVEVHAGATWNELEYISDAYKADLKEFGDKKQAWCDKYGAD